MRRAAKIVRPTSFESFDPLKDAALSLNYLTQMTDPEAGHLPYWIVAPFQNPAFAEHNRNDDAELAASWYNGLSCVREMLETQEGEEVEAALRKLVLKPSLWNDNGIRFPEKRPWSPVVYITFSELAAVLSALNRMLEVNPKDTEAEERAAGLVAGLRKLVLEHKVRMPWSGPIEVEEPSYFFPSDVYFRDKGFDPAVTSGVGETVLRNAVLISPLMDRYEQRRDEASLELATGLANYLLGMSHYFNYRLEFFGHVHSALWTAAGLGKLGRFTQQDRYVAKCKGIYDFVRRHSSAFGWVPEYMQWQLIADECCDACNIKAMMLCALEMVDCGFPEYWDDVHRFWRNHLNESKLLNTDFVAGDSSIPDTEQRTYRNIAERMLGGISGGSKPNGNPLEQFRFLAGCCAGTAPQAMLAAWRATTEIRRGVLMLNMPVNIECSLASVEVCYPNEGCIRLRLKRSCRVIIRVFPWMPAPHEGTIDGRPAGLERREDMVFFPTCEKGALLEFRHELKTRRVMEHVGGNDYFGIWRGPDMIDVLPHSPGYRFYQRGVGVPKEFPPAVTEVTSGEVEILTEPPPMKETRLNRRKPPRI